MLISLQSDLKKRIRLSLIIDLANDSIGSSECRDSTSKSTSSSSQAKIYRSHDKYSFAPDSIVGVVRKQPHKCETGV